MLVLAAISFMALAICICYALVVWMHRNRYTRERFSFAALASITTLGLSLISSLGSNVMPWHMAATVIELLTGKKVPIPQTSWTDHALLLVAYVFAIWIIRELHRDWDGVKSVAQREREAHGEPTGIVKEGVVEFRRILRREPQLPQYAALDRRHFISQLEPITDSLAWRDQARELVRLSTSSFAFDQDSGWQDNAGCWLGLNTDNGCAVCLYPLHEPASDDEIPRFLHGASELCAAHGRRLGDIILAVQADTPIRAEDHNGVRLSIRSESDLLDKLVDFTDYRNDIRKRVLVNRLPDSNLVLADSYVPSMYLTGQNSAPQPDVGRFLGEWLREPGQRQIALLGEYGQGKSTASLMFSFQLLEQDCPIRIPIIIELRGTSPRNLDPLGLLGAWAAKYNINAQALMRLQIAGRLLLIFEGFDEMALVGDAEMRLKHFRTLWQFCYPGAKILITGRPNLFLDEEEMRAALGIDMPIADKPYCQPVRLAPFTVEQVSGALRSHDDQTRKQICALVEHNPHLRELVSRPSLLHIVAVLWKREKLYEQVASLTSAYIMELFVRHSYRRQGVKEIDSPGFMALTTSERDYFMKGVASYMASNHLPNQIAHHQLNQAIEALLEGIPDSVSTSTAAITGESTTPLRLRIEKTEQGLEHIQTDVRACGLLVDDPATPGAFRFGHKSFMEFLFASTMCDYLVNKTPGAVAIVASTKANIGHMLDLPVAVDFLAELMGREAKGPSELRAMAQTQDYYQTARLLLAKFFGISGLALFLLRGRIAVDVFWRSFASNKRRRVAMVFTMTTALTVFGVSHFIVREFLVNRSPSGLPRIFVLLILTTVLLQLTMISCARTINRTSRTGIALHLWEPCLPRTGNTRSRASPGCPQQLLSLGSIATFQLLFLPRRR